MVSYEYLKEDLPGFQEHLVVLHQEGEHGVLVPVLVQYRHLLKNRFKKTKRTVRRFSTGKRFNLHLKDRSRAQPISKRPEKGLIYI